MAKDRRTNKLKRAPSVRDARPTSVKQDARSEPRSLPDDQISFGATALHQLFEQQARQMLDRTDLDEEQKQHILVAMSCPCCGAGAMSYTAKLKR